MVAEAPAKIEVTEGNVAETLEIPAPAAVEPVVEAAEAAPQTEVPQPAPPRAIADYADDELEAEPKVKELLRRREQSIKDRATALERQRSDAALQQYVARGEYVDDLASAYTIEGAAGMETIQADRKKLGDVVGKLQGALAAQTSAQAYSALNEMLPYEGLPAETRERIRTAGPEWMAAYIDAIADARAAEREPERRKQWEADYAKQQAAKAVVREREAASGARQTIGATTGLTGSAPKTFASRRELDRAHMDGEITTATAKEWRDSGRYADLPF